MTSTSNVGVSRANSNVSSQGTDQNVEKKRKYEGLTFELRNPSDSFTSVLNIDQPRGFLVNDFHPDTNPIFDAITQRSKTLEGHYSLLASSLRGVLDKLNEDFNTLNGHFLALESHLIADDPVAMLDLHNAIELALLRVNINLGGERGILADLEDLLGVMKDDLDDDLKDQEDLDLIVEDFGLAAQALQHSKRSLADIGESLREVVKLIQSAVDPEQSTKKRKILPPEN
jgi:hypothetical protein